MRYGSVCSGIEAATVAWHPLGWRPAFFAQHDPEHDYTRGPDFPSRVLAHHYPEVPNLGDFTRITSAHVDGAIDLLVGGTPCQSFSVAGLRGGLADDRGNLALEYLRLAQRLRPRWLVWENVPGVHSSVSHVTPDPRPPQIDLDGGDGPRDGTEVVVADEYDADEAHAFACFVAGLSELGYGWAYRVLDAQFIRVDGFARAVPQRRRRVFVVGYLGDWRRAAAVLFEPESMLGHPPPRREAGARVAGAVTAGVGGGGGGADDNDARGNHLVAGALGGTSPGGGSRFGADEAAANQLVAFGGNDTSGPIKVATARNAHAGPHGRLDFESEYAAETDPGSLLRRVRSAIGAEALAAWGLGILDSLQPKEILRSALHGCELRPAAFSRSWVVYCALAREENRAAGAMQSMREAISSRRAPQGWEPPQQLARELGAYLSELSQPGAQAERLLHDLWPASEGLGVLRQALSAAQAARRPAGSEDQPTSPCWRVRRLTCEECEFLQGFPRGYTLIDVRGKPAPDGPRYKAIGNSMAVNVMRWIGMRIGLVDGVVRCAA